MATINEKAKKCWNITSVSEEEGEIVLYGDVESQQPVDWWTGEAAPGLYITPEGFMNDLEAVKNKSRLTVKLNSCGGDLYTGIAIHNAIKALKSHVTVIVEGIAASAASVIMCAGDTVQVYPGSLVMIHEPACTVIDYCNRDDLKAIIKMLEAGIDATAEIYHARTNLEIDTLKSMMHKETWMTGAEAVSKGFADEVINGADVDMRLAGKEVLMVAGIKHSIKGLHIPESLRESILPEEMDADTTASFCGSEGEINKPDTSAGESEEGGTAEMYNSVDELRAAQPELVSQIEADAAEAAIEKERARQQAIDEIAPSVADATLIAEAKYGAPCSAEQLALRALQKQAQLGAKFLSNTAEDNAASGVQKVEASVSNDEQPKTMTKEERMAQGRADAKAINKKED